MSSTRIAQFDTFFNAYLDCLIWQAIHYTDEDCSGVSFEDAGVGVDSLTLKARKTLREEALNFYRANYADLLAALDDHGSSLEQSGHDFCLTRLGHGAGFWDRGMGELGTKLTQASKPYGDVHIYIQRGRIHVG